jgi:hypothetical protein
LTASLISDSRVAPGFHETDSFSVAKLTEAVDTPGTLATARSMAVAQAEQVMPPIGTVASFEATGNMAS